MKNFKKLFKALKQKQAAETTSMTDDEAIKQIDDMIAHAEDMLKNEDADDIWKKDKAALEIGKEAIYKQIPMTPVIKMNAKSLVFVEYEDGHGETIEKFNDIYCCPRCLNLLSKLMKIEDSRVPMNKVRHCDKCGQKIDWKGEGM